MAAPHFSTSAVTGPAVPAQLTFTLACNRLTDPLGLPPWFQSSVVRRATSVQCPALTDSNCSSSRIGSAHSAASTYGWQRERRLLTLGLSRSILAPRSTQRLTRDRLISLPIVKRSSLYRTGPAGLAVSTYTRVNAQKQRAHEGRCDPRR